ncbi:MAG: methyltransferase domain-containing protein [Xanthomonadaceae bacterium]|nr:methyltransferase domain-containing protein [Xanthomonadaceae bacterium]
MNEQKKAVTQLEFSEKYDQEHSKNYYFKHQKGLRRRLTNWREQRMARQGLQLAGNPQSILDLPCGAGRFWPLLASDPSRTLYAADNSQDMIETATRFQPPELVSRFTCFQTSAFNIDLSDASVDTIFCMRLLHHIAREEDRLAILREFHRVCRDSVCLSIWVDGNLQACRRKKLELQRQARRIESKKFKNRILLTKTQAESEYHQAGFKIIGHFDLLPKFSMWRLYVLKKQ